MSPEDERSRVISVRFPADVYRSAKALAALSGDSFNAIVVTAVRSFVDEHASDEAIAAMVERHRASLRRPPDDA